MRLFLKASRWASIHNSVVSVIEAGRKFHRTGSPASTPAAMKDTIHTYTRGRCRCENNSGYGDYKNLLDVYENTVHILVAQLRTSEGWGESTHA